MTCLAESLLMLAQQRVARILVVIESECLPILFGMASLAFVAVIPLVAFFLVIFAVASDTGHFQLLPGGRTGYTLLVTCLALGIAVLALKWVLGVLVVIKIGRFPALIVVTTLAFFAQTSPMTFLLIILAMAGHAGHR